MFVEVLDADEMPLIPLRKIPKKYSIIDTKSDYLLAGIIDFKPPIRKSGVGHYTAICPQTPDKWSEYNDLMDKEKFRAASFLSGPSLIIYHKVQS